MGDEYDAAEAAYWNGETDVGSEFWEQEAFLHREYGAGIPRDHYSMMPAISVKRGGIQFPMAEKIAKELEVKNDQEILTQAEELRAEADRLEKIVAEREKYGSDPFKNGDVLKVDMRYRTGSRRSFAYGVVKVAGKFYLTGRLFHAAPGMTESPQSGWTWETFVAWLSQGDATVWQARALKQIF